MREKRTIVDMVAIFCLTAILAICLLFAAASAQSRDDRKDRSGDKKREEPTREEPKRDGGGDREASRERATPREPARESRERPSRESGGRKTRERPSRSDGRERSSSGDRQSDSDRSNPGRSGSRDKRTIPDRSTPDGTNLPERRRPPKRPSGDDYDRSRDGGSAGVRPVDPFKPPIRPPRRYPVPEEVDGTRRKEVPAPDGRARIIMEGWPYPPPWHPVVLWPYYEPMPLPKPDPYLIHLPFGTIRPREIEDGFILLLSDLWRDGMQDALLVCIIQTYREMDVDRFELFFAAEEDVTLYGSFTTNSFLALVSVRSIYELLEDPRVRWIGEYKPYYKINDSVRLWDYDGAFVFPLEEDGTEFREDLEDIYLAPEFYDEELGFYYVPAEDYELEAISELWWVAEVLRVVSDPDLVYDYGYEAYD